MIRDVDCVSLCCIRSRRLNFIRSLLCVRLRPADARDARSFARQPHRNRMSDPPPCSCYDSDLVLKSHDFPRRIDAFSEMRTARF